MRIAYSTQSPIGTAVSQDAIQAIQTTVQLLEALGHEVVEERPAIDGMQLAKDFITTWFSQFAYLIAEIETRLPARHDNFELDSLALAALVPKLLL